MAGGGLELLEREELTRRGDEVAQQRRETAVGEGREGVPLRHRRRQCLAGGVVPGRSQFLVYHFMFGPEYTAGCPSCSAIADGFNGFAVHLANHDVMLWAVSRAPLAKLQAFKRRMGWTFPVGVLARRRLQLRFQRLVHRGAAARGQRRIQLPARGPSRSRAEAPRRRTRGRSKGAAMTGTDVADLRARAARHERVRARGRRRLPHLFRPMRAGSTACGACTSGSIAPPRGATSRGTGYASTVTTRMSTTTQRENRDRCQPGTCVAASPAAEIRRREWPRRGVATWRN